MMIAAIFIYFKKFFKTMNKYNFKKLITVNKLLS